MESWIKEYLDYLKLKAYRKSTIESLLKSAREYEDYLSRNDNNAKGYLPFLENRKHKNNPNRRLNKSTLNIYIYGLRVYFSYLEKIKGSQTPVYLLSYKVEPKKIEILSISEIELLYKSAVSLRDKVVLVCLYDLGLRILESSRLKVEDINLDSRLIFISQSKTGKQREVPLSERAYKVLSAYLIGRENVNENLLQGLKGDLGVHGISRILKIIVERSGLEKNIYPHLLRHSIATHLLYNGMEIDILSLFLGHSSLESTQRYTHLIINNKSLVMDNEKLEKQA